LEHKRIILAKVQLKYGNRAMHVMQPREIRFCFQASQYLYHKSKFRSMVSFIAIRSWKLDHMFMHFESFTCSE
jgi:hypothetical protein